MAFKSIEQLEKVTDNRYEAVIIAAQRARHLNSKRLAKMQRAEEGVGAFDIDGRKITMVALEDLIEGRVKFERPQSN